MQRKYYAFEYTDGRNTTTGNNDNIHAAGSLYFFKSPTSRDAFVAESPYCHRRGRYIIREAVKVSALPQGWRASEAEDYASED